MLLTALSRKKVFWIGAILVAAKIAGFVILGAGGAGSVFTHASEVVANVLAILCAVAASRRARGVARLFWLLFGSAFALQLVADIGWTYCVYFNVNVPEAALFPSLFYRLYAAPMAIALFLSDDVRNSRLETFLDACIVVGLVGLGTYQVQMAELKPHDPNMGQLITTTAVVNGLLLLVTIARFVFSTPGTLHRLFGRLTIYLIVYNSIAFATSYVDAYLPGVDDAFDLIWIVTYLTAATLAIRWDPSPVPEQPAKPRISRRAALLCFNLTMATMVLSSAVLGLRMVDTPHMVGLVAVGLVLFSYAIRCALMQDAQEKYMTALKESNTRYELVSLATNDVLWDRNLGTNRISWNDNLYSLFGYQPGDVPADRDWWINNVHPEDREPILASLRDLLASENNAWSGEYRFRRANGSYAFVFDRSYVVRDGTGKPIRLIGSIQDLTVRKQAELEIERARKAAEAAAQAKTEFLSNMSHEIRTPLNGIMGMLELADQTNLSFEQRDLLAMARESADTLMSVVNDVLDFSKIEADRLELEKAEFDISDAVTEATRTIVIRAHQKQIDLNYYVVPDVPCRVVGDPARLKQVLVNLLGNAVKFTEKGQILLLVEQENSGADEICLRFSVTDTGIGIPQEKREAIFHAFSQADNSITRRFGGTGLGLAISSKIVKLMQGRIWVESEMGKGSTFFFTARFDTAPSSNDSRAQRSELQGARVLIAEGHPVSTALARDILASCGAHVVTVASADEALHTLADGSEGTAFCLLLCDSLLSDMSGFELIKQAKRSSCPLPKTIMMLTPENYPNAVARCRELGIPGHLIKPFKRSELLSAVQQILKGKGTNAEPASGLRGESSSTGPLNILLAEDNLVNQKLALRMLEKLGHNVEVVENGRQALQKVQSKRVDLVLMDGHMPEMDGLAATRAIREWEKASGGHTPIVAMTAMAMEGDEEACRMAGMDAFIAKPISMQMLQQVIQKVMAAPGPLRIEIEVESAQKQLSV